MVVRKVFQAERTDRAEFMLQVMYIQFLWSYCSTYQESFSTYSDVRQAGVGRIVVAQCLAIIDVLKNVSCFFI